MMKKKDTKQKLERKYIFFHGLWCLFLSSFLSGQIYIKDSTIVYVSGQAFVSQQSDIPENKEVAKIFLKENANITDPEHLVNGKIIYINELPAKSLAKRQKSKERKNEKIRKTESGYKNLFSVKGTTEKDSSFTKSKIVSGIGFSLSDTHKIAANLKDNSVKIDLSFLKKYDIHIRNDPALQKRDNSFWTIRPPPFLFNKTQIQHINFGKEVFNCFFPV